MNYDVIFKNVKQKNILDYFTVEITKDNQFNNLIVFKSTSYPEASEIFNRVVKEMKDNKPEDSDKNVVILSKVNMGNRGDGWMNLVQARRKNQWSLELVQGAFEYEE